MSLQDEGLNVSFMLAGLFGSLMCMSKTASLQVKRTVFATIGGAASANYLTPLILDITKLGHSSSYSHAIAFMLGFTGLKSLEWLTNRFITEPDEHTHHSKRHR
jgi:hypothetical protein